MSHMLEQLSKEYLHLIEQHKTIVGRINAVAETIKHYGGNVPNVDELNLDEVATIQAALRQSMYPINGTWGDKICYALRKLGKPSSASQVFTYISSVDKTAVNKFNFDNTSNTVAATCSRLAKEGVIGLDNSESINLYYILGE